MLFATNVKPDSLPFYKSTTTLSNTYVKASVVFLRSDCHLCLLLQ